MNPLNFNQEDFINDSIPTFDQTGKELWETMYLTVEP
eukprot:CAMPEP_0182433022 /NCGR_PEP_ID=MMETSP1167-20130531/60285_1 /TAXON_ID=2988 /ORGANISM="Mallomonas Sp, Strain CCMP3275" /LENGTH=36 /DNA_ID= /DNA_START= /DNA_END= /DNA_ORIENTATION=